jgi:AraC-like DNA-binding protein
VLFIPLPFVVALLLAIRFVVLLRNQESGNRPFLALIGLCILQSIVVGLRWGYDLTALRYVLPVLAAAVPPLVLASFRSLIQPDRPDMPWLNALPPLVVIGLLLFAPYFIDVALVVIFVGYAAILLRLATAGPDGLEEARLDGAAGAHKALLIAAGALCLSASFDIAVVLDFEWSRGENVPMMVSNANLLSLFLLGLTATVAARARALPAPPGETDQDPSVEERDRDVLERVDRLLATQNLFRDENLTLARLARRAGVPARQISGAINRLAGKNVSQYINDFPHRRGLPAAARDRHAGDHGHVRIRLPDEIELQPRIPPGHHAEPRQLASGQPRAKLGGKLMLRPVVVPSPVFSARGW